MSSRLHPHSPLPAPALHATNLTTQSKSHVLAGVQDAYWSDDEAEDAECPLCLEEMDISDLNFKPCPCGYQICRFCWHHIKENLNGRCPACRREYTDEAVQFKPINKEDHKRLTQQKKQRERERKELDALGRRQLANVRVVQRNVVYVVGIGPRFAKEELIPTLRSNEYFGQYGKISKILIVKRTPPGGRAPVIGLYITFHRREDAARAITAVDGATSPGGGHEVMRASYGTTKYCMAFLRGVSCADHSCMNLHEWGDEKDCFTKEDLTTLKHTMKDTENRTRTTIVTRKADESDTGLPRAASWANRGTPTLASTALHNNTNSTSPLSSTRPRRAQASSRQPRTSSTSTNIVMSDSRSSGRDRKGVGTTKSPSQASSSRPATPATLPNRPVTPSNPKISKHKEQIPPTPALPSSVVPPPRSPTSSVAVDSDIGSVMQEVAPSIVASQSTPASPPSVPPGIPVVPPGLSIPPGLPPPSRMSHPAAPSSQGVAQALQSDYQMSTQARAIFEDLVARREFAPATTNQSPFPDFDRALEALTRGSGGFSFNLDPKLAGDNQDATFSLPDLDVSPDVPFHGTYLAGFPALQKPGQAAQSPLLSPPGLAFSNIPMQNRPIFDPTTGKLSVLERQPSVSSSSYTGSFNPFGEGNEDAESRKFSPFDEERKVSRFGFARGRQGSSSSPVHASSPLSNSDHPHPFYTSPEHASPVNLSQWPLQNRHHEYAHQPNSAMSSPLAQHGQAQSPYSQQHASRFQPFDNNVSEAQLRDLITLSNSGRDRAIPTRNGLVDPHAYKYDIGQHFSDPAIMSARMASPASLTPLQPVHDTAFSNPASTAESFSSLHLAYGPPPGISYPHGIIPSPSISSTQGQTHIESQAGSAHVSTSPSVMPSPILSSSDFPALSAVEPSPRHSEDGPPPATPVLDSTAQAKAERKAAKKQAAAERAAERQRIALEKAAVRAAEKERLAQEKAIEKEKSAILKAEKEQAAKEKADLEKAEREKVAREKAEKDRITKEKAAAEEQAKKVQSSAATAKQPTKSDAIALSSIKAPRRPSTAKQTLPAAVSSSAHEAHVPILSKMPKKNKPIAKPIRIPKEQPIPEIASSILSAATSETSQLPEARTTESTSNNSRAHSVDMAVFGEPTTVQELLTEIDIQFPWMNVSHHPIFDMQKINPAAKMPLEYGPLVHALSALSVGGGSFANNMPSGSIDNAVSSFQQLLETLTQTISDLLRLLPRTTWDDSSSFDGVLRDMLKGDDFLDDGGDDQNGQAKEDEVAALTLALERRARWMEVQLSKLEELHRDINTAAVRAVLSFNDNGWDPHGFLPRVGNTLHRFDQIGMISTEDGVRPMTADELEKKLIVAQEAAIFAEAELKEVVHSLQMLRPTEDEY